MQVATSRSGLEDNDLMDQDPPDNQCLFAAPIPRYEDVPQDTAAPMDVDAAPPGELVLPLSHASSLVQHPETCVLHEHLGPCHPACC